MTGTLHHHPRRLLLLLLLLLLPVLLLLPPSMSRTPYGRLVAVVVGASPPSPHQLGGFEAFFGSPVVVRRVSRSGAQHGTTATRAMMTTTTLCYSHHHHHSPVRQVLPPPNTLPQQQQPPPPPPPPTHRHIRILGGGLAGLSVAYHLLVLWHQPPPPEEEETTPRAVMGLTITICDTEPDIGTGGASAVAGGLLHPLSPRGKIVHWGLEGLAATNQMIDAAIQATSAIGTESLPSTAHVPSTIRLRDELYRLPISNEQKIQLQEIASQHPTIAEWRNHIGNENTPEDASSTTNVEPEPSGPVGGGGLRLHNGCCVVHVPSYLRGVYHACQILARNTTGASIRWCPILPTTNSSISGTAIPDNGDNRSDEHQHYDDTIYCYGSNMFQSLDNHHSVVSEFIAGGTPSSSESNDAPRLSLPVQLVRGQSMEVTLAQPLDQALLCGKYISPLPSSSSPSSPQQYRALIGATHEFSKIPLTSDQVRTELQRRTRDFSPFSYPEDGPRNGTDEHSSGGTVKSKRPVVTLVDRITSGYRVQSTRSDYGRRPIIGQLPVVGDDVGPGHPHSRRWIFTGLSSRGLLYHALYGQRLAQAIRQTDESVLLEHCPDILWWKS